jgi:cytochrome c55X
MSMKTFPGYVLTGLALIGFALTAAAQPVAPEEPSVKRQQQLRQLLLQDCSVCHGKLLHGNLAPPLTPAALDGKSERLLVRTIIQGHGETEMPGWGWKLEDHEARWLVRLIRATNK